MYEETISFALGVPLLIVSCFIKGSKQVLGNIMYQLVH